MGLFFKQKIDEFRRRPCRTQDSPNRLVVEDLTLQVRSCCYFSGLQNVN
jgi:hypothetical protein